MFGTLPPCPHEDVGEFFEVQLGFPSHSRVFENRVFKGFCDSFVRKNDAYLDSRRPERRKAVGQIVCVQLEKQNSKSFWALPGLSLTQSYLRTLLACLLQTKKSFSFCDLTNRSSYFTRMGWFWVPRVVHLRFRVYNQEPEVPPLLAFPRI